MPAEDADDFVRFQDVRVIRSTAPALFCRIGERSVWLPRWHISGKLWCTGDRGNLFIRRWLARERNLIDEQGAMTRSSLPSLVRLPAALHVVRRDRNPLHDK